MNDRTKMAKIKEWGQARVELQDEYIFDFEADFEKLMKKINIRRLVNKDRKYLKTFKDTIMAMYRKVYLQEVMKSGEKQARLFMEIFTEETA